VARAICAGTSPPRNHVNREVDLSQKLIHDEPSRRFARNRRVVWRLFPCSVCWWPNEPVIPQRSPSHLEVGSMGSPEGVPVQAAATQSTLLF
jgi:hypothetical protein